MWGPRKDLTFPAEFIVDSERREPEATSVEEGNEDIPWNFLISVLQWPCGLAQFAGYWPLKLVDGAQWKFKWKSFQAVKVVLMPIIALLSTLGVWINAKSLFGHLSVNLTVTERVGHGLVSTVSQIGVTILMISSIINRNGIASIWNGLNTACNDTLQFIISNSEYEKMSERKFLRWIRKRHFAARVGTVFIFLEALTNVMLTAYEILPNMFHVHGYNQGTITAASLIASWLVVFRLYLTFNTILLASLLVIAGLYEHLTRQLRILEGAHLEERFDKVAFIKSRPKSPYPNRLFTRIGSLLKLGDDLEKVVDKLNHKLKTQILVILTILGISIVFNAFTLVVNMPLDKELFGGSGIGRKKTAEMFCFIIDVIMFAIICSSASALTHNAQLFGDQLGKLVSSPSLSPNLVSRIQHTACKFSLKPPVFAPGYYFVVNNQLLTSLVAMVATYLTVLLQFSSH